MMAKKLDVYVSPLVERNASLEMSQLFGSDKKFGTWRRLWLELAKAEKNLGLDIKQTQINEMAKHLDDIDYKAQVDDGCPVNIVLGCIVGVPSVGCDPIITESAYIITTPTSIIEEGVLAIEQAMPGQGFHGGGQVVAHQCCSVPVDLIVRGLTI